MALVLRLKPRIACSTGSKRTPEAPSIAGQDLGFLWFARSSNCMAVQSRSNRRPARGRQWLAYFRYSTLQSEPRPDHNRAGALVRLKTLHYHLPIDEPDTGSREYHMKIDCAKFVRIAACACAVLVLAGAVLKSSLARAAWPDHTITIIVPFPPGG